MLAVSRANSRLTQIVLKDKNAEIPPQAVPLFEERGPFACERWRVLERQRCSRTDGATICNKAKINGKPFDIRVPSARIINRFAAVPLHTTEGGRGKAALTAFINENNTKREYLVNINKNY